MKNQLLIVFVALILLVGCSSTVPKQQGITITTTDLPEWVSEDPGSFTLNAAGGVPPYTWAVTGGNLLAGLTLAQNGVISGTHILAPGTSKSISPPFTVTVTDAAGANKSVALTITVTEAPPKIEILTAVCTAGLPCNAQIANAGGGTPPYTFQQDTLRQGVLPFGITVGVDGSLTGSTDQPGAYTFGVCVKDTVALSDCAQATLEIEEAKELEIIMETWTGTFGGKYEQHSHCVDGEFTYTFSFSFEYPGSLVRVLRGEIEQPREEGLGFTTRGTISASAVPTKNIQTRAKFYPDCRLIGGSYENAPLGVDAYEGGLRMYTTDDTIDIVPTSYIYFTENTELTDYGNLIFEIEEITDTTASGTWGVGNYLEPTGSFSFVKS